MLQMVWRVTQREEPDEAELPPLLLPEAEDEYDSEEALLLRAGRLGGDACHMQSSLIILPACRHCRVSKAAVSCRRR